MGRGYEENGFLVLEYQPESHVESIFVRFKQNIIGNDEVLLGLWSAWDFDNKAAVGIMVLSRNELSEKEVREMCQSIKTNPQIKYMKIL